MVVQGTMTTTDPSGGGAEPLVEVEPSCVGDGFVGSKALRLFLAALLLGALFALVHLWIFWPTSLETTGGGASPGEQPAEKVVEYLGIAGFELSTEVLFFIVVSLAGALGGLIHATRSLAIYAGARTVRWSWIAYYLFLPLIGALGGTLFYVVLRVGLFSPSTEVDQASPFGFAAVAALLGLFFSERAREAVPARGADLRAGQTRSGLLQPDEMIPTSRWR
jgi:hypothetical protein